MTEIHTKPPRKEEALLPHRRKLEEGQGCSQVSGANGPRTLSLPHLHFPLLAMLLPTDRFPPSSLEKGLRSSWTHIFRSNSRGNDCCSFHSNSKDTRLPLWLARLGTCAHLHGPRTRGLATGPARITWLRECLRKWAPLT